MALNPRQTKFAKLVAAGMAIVDARQAAFGDSYPPATRKTHAEAGSRLAKKPEVRAAIEQYANELTPIGDYRVARERMEANMQYLATQSPDHRVRLAASKMLHEIASERENRERDRRTVTIDSLVQEIGQLQAPEPTEPLEMETETPTEPKPEAEPKTDSETDETDD